MQIGWSSLRLFWLTHSPRISLTPCNLHILFFIFQELEKDSSFVSSPLSVEYVLGLLTLGCVEPAHSELLTALGVPSDDAVSYITLWMKFYKTSYFMRSF